MLKKQASKNVLATHFHVILFMAKALFTFVICTLLQLVPRFNGSWIWLVWIALTVIIDALLLFKKPAFFTEIHLTEAEMNKLGLTSMELTKYLMFSAKLRLARMILTTVVFFIFLTISDSFDNLPIWLLFGFFSEFFVKKCLNIKTPLSPHNTTEDLPKSALEFHRNNPGFPGSAAWNATHRTRDIVPPKLL